MHTLANDALLSHQITKILTDMRFHSNRGQSYVKTELTSPYHSRVSIANTLTRLKQHPAFIDYDIRLRQKDEENQYRLEIVPNGKIGGLEPPPRSTTKPKVEKIGRKNSYANTKEWCDAVAIEAYQAKTATGSPTITREMPLMPTQQGTFATYPQLKNNLDIIRNDQLATYFLSYTYNRRTGHFTVSITDCTNEN